MRQLGFNAESLKLYLVTDRGLCGDKTLEQTVCEAVRGGVTMVQLREKEASTKEFIEIGCRLKSLLSAFGVPLIINDRVDVALACDADGVHLGQSDMPYYLARKLLGPGKIIGLSVENMEQVTLANQLNVDYIGISPVFSTSTKTDTAPSFGLDGLREAVKLSAHPSVGIGGINKDNIAQIFSCGVDGAALVSAICASSNPYEAARQLSGISETVLK